MKANNTICWVDIPVENLDRAIHFYAAVLAQSIEKIAELGFEFGLLPHEKDTVSGCLTDMNDRKPSKNGPLVYLNVEGRLAKATQTAREKGGEILQSPEKIGPYGHRAIILDTEGNAIALYSKNEDLT